MAGNFSINAVKVVKNVSCTGRAVNIVDAPSSSIFDLLELFYHSWLSWSYYIEAGAVLDSLGRWHEFHEQYENH
jgi:hypothetical protein